MLPADAVIQIDLAAAGTIALAVGSGIVGAAKLLVGYLARKDAQITAEIGANRIERQELTGTLVRLQQESTRAAGELRGAITSLADRLDRTELARDSGG